ncbi:multiubiquitin domain-containing protein [Antrihabitans sp. YC2-6]|uniref:multiubiquitin domain-containing protein n=1 Tax=Antrihabitans sp. YC2-6 TaxID=2799498 RepID=UPI0018F2FA8C|nr:multiubiquitin domain-containing protein [Antrihabitans sp. YC2-6]MBJ8348663.1 multiubiquitin domain-containing protein [Antrihabitans sp. YC2-6]
MTAPEIETTVGHEHHDRTVTIVVNTRPHEWAERTISYEEVVELTYPGHPVGDGEEVTVRFTRGHQDKREGSLTPGRSVKVKNKMVFDVYRTSRS